MDNTISLEGLDKAEVLVALYNASKPFGMGFLHYDPAPMTTDEARELLEQQSYFDHLKGRVMKVDLGGDRLEASGYDRDNGPGAAQQAIDAIGKPLESNEEKVTQEARRVLKMLDQETTIKSGDGIAVITLGLADVSEPLKAAIGKVIKE